MGGFEFITYRAVLYVYYDVSTVLQENFLLYEHAYAGLIMHFLR